MQIRDAAARRRARMAFRKNLRANQGASCVHHLCDRALQVRSADAVDPLKRTHDSIAVRVGMCRCDPDNCSPGHDEHDTEISQSGNALPDDVSKVASCDLCGGGRRDHRGWFNRLIHEEALTTR